MSVAILGAGPAGMSCANALASFGIDCLVVERGDHPGGVQRVNFHPNLWLLGAPGESGRDITARMSRHFAELPVVRHLNTEVRRVARQAGGFQLDLAGPAGEFSQTVAAIVLATGMWPRATPEYERLRAVSQRVIIGPLSEVIRDGIRHSRVLILGGGDNAFDHALFLAERGNRPLICARGRFSARRQFQKACAAQPDIAFRENGLPLTVEPLGQGFRVGWPDGSEYFDWLLVMFGYRPNTDVLERFAPELRPALNATGHVQVDRWQHTSVPGLYAAGDITDPPQPSVAAALAQGLTAAKAIERDLFPV